MDSEWLYGMWNSVEESGKWLKGQHFPKKFPENRDILIGCIFISYAKEKNVILFTYPTPVSFNTTGLIVSSKLPRFSDMYTPTIANANPKSISANKPVQLVKSATKWFTKDGILVEGLFWKDVERLLDDYNGERKNK
ncbi:probable signal peptidase complex subunit 2 [Phalaenopsis equestris]|uniref:probable signal peptidase complex subunit 2 n=1 Tax=Phalaenopsis equestris TaxID=78828 RepID=UPI0009E1E7AC|nr:probable signal peptidase complex subunit 2 [Phalaenopsis equestris]